MQQLHVRRVVEVADAREALGHLDALFGERGRVLFFVNVIEQARVLLQINIAVRLFDLGHALLLLGLEPHYAVVSDVVLLGRLFGRARDDERRSRFVYKDRVDFVNYRVVVAALHHRRRVEFHVVAQVVEAELVVRAVGDVGVVGLLALHVVHVVLYAADREAEEAIDLAHPLGVAFGQVVVDRDDMHAATGDGVQVSRAAWRPASCLRRSSSRRSCRDAAPCRLSTERRSGACPSRAAKPRARRRRLRPVSLRALRRSRARSAFFCSSGVPPPMSASATRLSTCSRNFAVRARSSSSLRPFISASSALISATTGHRRLSNRSLALPKIFVATLFNIAVISLSSFRLSSRYYQKPISLLDTGGLVIKRRPSPTGLR